MGTSSETLFGCYHITFSLGQTSQADNWYLSSKDLGQSFCINILLTMHFLACNNST